MKSILTAITLLILVSCKKTQDTQTQEKVQEQSTALVRVKNSEALFLTGAPTLMQNRHIWISEHSNLGQDGNIPVHICYRRDQSEPWTLRGTGTIFAKYPGHVFSAYHVFSDAKGQFAYRKIGPDELSGETKFDGYITQPETLDHVNDSIVCPTSKDGQTTILIPGSAKAKTDWIGSRQYKVTIFSRIARFSTYPEIPIRTICMIEIEEDVYYVLLNWEVYPAESGTLVTIDGGDGKLVLICGQSIPVEIYNALPRDQQSSLNWTATKLFAMCNAVQVK